MGNNIKQEYMYNYIFFNFDYDFYQPIVVPLNNLNNVFINRKDSKGSFLRNKLFFYHWSKKVNNVVHLPLKKIWFPSMYANPFVNDNPICFVFNSGKYINDSDELRAYILNQNPKNKCIIYCGDLIAKKNWDIEKVKRSCDAIVTYDPGEAQKYGIYCFNKPVYGRIAPLTQPQKFEYDAYFLGFAKDRLQIIRNTFKRLSDSGLRCLFIVCGVSKEEQKDDGIRYSDPISYSENIDIVNRSKCLVEIIQGGSDTITLRCNEAIAYHRKLLTNYIGIKQTEYYNPKFMSAFTNPEEIDIDFIQQPIDYTVYKDEEKNSPIRMLDYFENILEEIENEPYN